MSVLFLFLTCYYFQKLATFASNQKLTRSYFLNTWDPTINEQLSAQISEQFIIAIRSAVLAPFFALVQTERLQTVVTDFLTFPFLTFYNWKET